MHISNPERAIVPASIQFILIAILAGALYAYLKSRCGRKATVIVLALGELVSFLPLGLEMFQGLGEYGDTCRSWGGNYSDWLLILADFFELYTFAVSSFICLLMSSMILLLLKEFECQPNHADKSE